MKNEQHEFDKRMETEYPFIPWRSPIPIGTLDGRYHCFGCRLCIGRFGMKGDQIETMPQTMEEFEKHIEEVHGKR